MLINTAKYNDNTVMIGIKTSGRQRLVVQNIFLCIKNVEQKSWVKINANGLSLSGSLCQFDLYAFDGSQIGYKCF